MESDEEEAEESADDEAKNMICTTDKTSMPKKKREKKPKAPVIERIVTPSKEDALNSESSLEEEDTEMKQQHLLMHQSM